MDLQRPSPHGLRGGTNLRREDLVLSHAWKKESREAVIEAIKQLESLHGPIVAGEIELIEQRLATRLGVSFAEAVKTPLVSIHEASYLMGIKESVGQPGVSIAWNLPDLKSLDVLQKNTSFWIGEHYGDAVQKPIEDILNGFFTGGQDRAVVAQNLASAFSGVIDRSNAYWDLLADHTCTKVREIGRVSGYERAGIEYVQFRAWLDERTTAICRSMHGRIIAVRDLRSQVNGYLDACKTRDKDAIKASWPWVSDKQAEKLTGKTTRDLVKGNVSMPPLHAKCRSITVAWFEPEQPAKMEYGDGMSRDHRKAVGSFTAEEHKNFLSDVKQRAGSLSYAPDDFRDDIVKGPILKHAMKDFGVSAEDYLSTARRIAGNADRIFVRQYKGELQYCIASTHDMGYVVVDRDMNFRGCYGHAKPGGIEKCIEGQLMPRMAEIVF